MVTFCDTEYNILRQSWIDAGKDYNEEKKKILSAAVAIIRNDIYLQTCDNFYPPSYGMLDNVNESIPESLKFFTNALVSKNKNKYK